MEAGDDKGNFSDASERATALADVIETRHRSYDALALNEVFDESARAILLKVLKPIYPNVIEKTPASGPVGFEDSGLMLFSKLPINFTKHLVFDKSKGGDGGALKGALLVRFAEVSVIATHTQSDSDAEAIKVRVSQMTQLAKLAVEEIAATSNFIPVLIMGDMNINGNQLLAFGGAADILEFSEWVNTFDASAAAPPFFGSMLKDAWAFEFLPADPKTLKEDTDPGLTCGMNRYDFVLTTRPTPFQFTPDVRPLAVHRMRLAYELFTQATAGGKSSDHIGIVTSLQKDNGGLTPRKALTLSHSGELAPAHSGPLTRVDGECQLDGAQWLRIDIGGSYAFSLSSDDNSATYSTFLVSDFSRSVVNYKRETLEVELHQGKVKFQKYVLPSGPFYVLVQSSRRDRTFKYKFLAYRLIGTNPAEAITLVDHHTSMVHLKVGAPHSLAIAGIPVDTTDGVWFRVDPLGLTSSKAYNATLKVGGAGPGFGKATITLLRDGNPMRVVQQIAKTALPKTIPFSTKGNERFYLVVQRHSPQFEAARVTVRYESPVTLFHGVGQGIPGGGVMQIKCDDETNPEVLESDDISLEVRVDGKHFRTITNHEIGDFDDGDLKPLDPFFKNPIAFVDAVSFKVIDEDGEDPKDAESGTIVFPALPAAAVNAYHVKQSTAFADGTYSIYGNLSRYDPR
jgi:Endonuclease/Exonuclease/phosphatase family.